MSLRQLFSACAFLGLAILWPSSAIAQQVMVDYEMAVSTERLVSPNQSTTSRNTIEYLYDDGDGNTNQGPPSSFDPDMLWGNYFLTEEGGDVITQIMVAFGPNFPSLDDGPVTFWLLDDPEMSMDPYSANLLYSVEGTPDVFNDNFFVVDIPPTEVSGAFFVGASAKLQGGQDRPARVDTGGRTDRSFFCYAPEIADVIEDLASAPYCSRQDGGDVVIPGAFMVRAIGQAAGGGADPDVLAYWNFNNPADNGVVWPQPIAATSGNGSITYSFNENFVVTFAGSTINAQDGDPSGDSFVPQGGDDQVNNGEHLDISLSTLGYENIQLSFAGRGTGTGFGSEDDPNTVQYSTDGGLTFTTFDTYTSRQTSFQLYEFDFGNALDNQSEAIIRLVLDGSTSTNGNNRIDNVVVSGTETGDENYAQIMVDPLSFDVTALFAEGDVTRTLSIVNQGSADLEFSIGLSNDRVRSTRFIPEQSFTYEKNGVVQTVSNRAIQNPMGYGRAIADGFLSFESAEGFELGFIGGQQGWSTVTNNTLQPVVTDATSTDGSWSLGLSEHPGLSSGANVAAFSPLFLFDDDVIHITTDLMIEDFGGSDYQLIVQAPSLEVVAARVNFNWLGSIMILDDTGGGLAYHNAGGYEVGEWQTFEIVINRENATIDYYYGGELIWEGTVFAADIAEQVIFLHDNYNDGESGYFDNVQINYDGEGGEEHWLTLDTTEGVLGAGESIDVTLSFDTLYKLGTHTANVRILSNDPENSAIDVPVTYTLQDEDVPGDGPVATFAPSIEDGLTANVEPDESTIETLTIGNSGDEDLTFSFDDYAGFGRQGATVLLEEDFEGSFAPEGWDVDDVGEVACPWLSSDDYPLPTWEGPTLAAAIDSDTCGTAGMPADGIDSRLVTPAMDFSDASGVMLDFDLAFRSIGGSRLDLDVSTDGGTSWTTLQTWTGTDYGLPEGAPVNVDLSAYDGESSVTLSWRYVAGWHWWATVDNVVVTGAGGGEPSESFVTAVNPAAGSVAPGEEVVVSITFDSAGLGLGTFTDALSLTTNEDNGDYEYPVTMIVEEGGVPPVDGDLTFGPDIETGLEASVNAGDTTTGTFTINNPTGADIAYSFPQYSTAALYGDVMPAQPLSSADFPVFTDKSENHPTPSWMPTRGEGGPDEFGYTWIDSDEAGGPAFEAIDIASSGTALTLEPIPGCTITNVMDEGMAVVDLPFNFSFYGESYSQAWISVNGLVAFQPLDGCNFSSSPFPSASAPSTGAPGAMIGANWHDVVGVEGTSGIQTELLSDGRFVIQWTDWPRWTETGLNTTQLILSPGGAIKIQYLDINVQAGTLGGPNVGIQNHTFDDGLLVASSVDYLETGKAVLISSAPTFITDVSPVSGTIAAGESVDVTVTFDAAELIDGTYTGALTIETDEPSTYEYPVTLNVTGTAGCVITPDPIAFGGVIVGFDATQEATVTNSGSAACELTGATAGNDAYSVDFDAVMLTPGASATFSVTFAPTAVGAANTTLTLASPEGDVTAALTGTGVAAPIASVNPDELIFENMQPDQTATQSLTLSNLAGADAADLEFSVSIAAARPDVVARVITPQESTFRSQSSDVTVAGRTDGDSGFTYADGSIQSGSWMDYEGTPFAYRTGRNEVTITHSVSQAVESLSGVACPTPPSNVYRVFDLSEFDEISGSFSVTEVSFGIESVGSPGPSTVNLYTLDGPFVLNNLTLVNSETLSISSDDDLSIVTVPIEGEFSADDVLVVEWSIPRPQIFFGGNGAGQTGPTYVQADNCTGTEEPIDVALLDFPDSHWVLNVTGTSGPGVISVDPDEGSVEPEGSVTLTVTANTEGLEAGLYEFDVLIATNDPETPVLVVPVFVSVTTSTEGETTPLVFDLKPNYPNPFTSTTTIVFELPQVEHVTIDVIDLTGRRVALLVDEQMDAARHEVTWNANGLASGVYLYRMQAGSFTKTLRTTLVR